MLQVKCRVKLRLRIIEPETYDNSMDWEVTGETVKGAYEVQLLKEQDVNLFSFSYGPYLWTTMVNTFPEFFK